MTQCTVELAEIQAAYFYEREDLRFLLNESEKTVDSNISGMSNSLISSMLCTTSTNDMDNTIRAVFCLESQEAITKMCEGYHSVFSGRKESTYKSIV